MTEFKILKNSYLAQDIRAFYNVPYKTMGEKDNPNYLNDIKNTYGKPNTDDSISWAKDEQKKLDTAVETLSKVLKEDLAKILKTLKLDSLSICVVPRSKSESRYKDNQLLFKSTVKSVVKELEDCVDSSSYIVRTSDTKTTHLPIATPNFDNNGKDPYVGITEATCTISSEVKDKNILLIDDIYTKDVNINEDAIQSLLTKGAKSVTFYSVGACGI